MQDKRLNNIKTSFYGEIQLISLPRIKKVTFKNYIMMNLLTLNGERDLV